MDSTLTKTQTTAENKSDSLYPGADIALFCSVISMASREISKARRTVTVRYDLGPRGAWIIELLESGINSSSILSGILGVGRSLVAAEINRLLRARLIYSSPKVGDARRTVIGLTEEGILAATEMRQTMSDFMHDRLASHTRFELTACIALLHDFVGGRRIGERG